jgi:hypothetical protein
VLVSRLVLLQGRKDFRFARKDENAHVWGTGGINMNAVNGAFSPMMGEWRLREKTCVVSCVSDKEASRSKTQYPVLKTMILVKRRWGYHLWLFVFPLVAILLLSVLVLFSEMKDESDRYAATSALLFAAIQIKAQVALLLPRLHTATLLDKLTIYVLLFVFFTALASFFPAIKGWVHLGGPLLAFPLLWTTVVRLVWKKTAFLEATKIIYYRKKPLADAPLSAWEMLWHRTLWRLLICKIPHGWKGRGHINVADDQDRDSALEPWPKRGEFEP